MSNSKQIKDALKPPPKPKKTKLMMVPDDVLEKIMSFISYDEVSRCRLVCTRFNSVGQRVLNRGFHKVEKYHAQCLKKVKSQLPRRESERRKHHLARHCDILTAVETRLSLLGMTFLKFIDLNYCCFIPGKVLDEIFRVLRYVTTETSPVRAHEVLQELRDLSSMAMEYFDEKISPTFKKHKVPSARFVSGISFQPSAKPSTKSNSSPLLTPDAKYQKISSYVRQLLSKQNQANKDIASLQNKNNDLSKKCEELQKQCMDQQKILTIRDQKIKEHDQQIVAISKHLGIQFQSELDENTQFIKVEPELLQPVSIKREYPVKREPEDGETESAAPPRKRRRSRKRSESSERTPSKHEQERVSLLAELLAGVKKEPGVRVTNPASRIARRASTSRESLPVTICHRPITRSCTKNGARAVEAKI